MKDANLPARIFNNDVIERNRRGRPRLTWVNSMCRDLEEYRMKERNNYIIGQ